MASSAFLALRRVAFFFFFSWQTSCWEWQDVSEDARGKADIDHREFVAVDLNIRAVSESASDSKQERSSSVEVKRVIDEHPKTSGIDSDSRAPRAISRMT